MTRWSLPMQVMLEQAEAMIRKGQDRPLLILGESGSGRSWFAQSLHARTGRPSDLFVAVRCAELSTAGWETELLGVGDRPGKVEQARGGTLFLAELDKAPQALQEGLLTSLSQNQHQVQVMVSSAMDLGALVPGLLERFGATISLPPLRERREELQGLTGEFLAQLALPGQSSATLTADAIGAILLYPWPGNLRELRQALHHALIRTEGRGPIDLPHLPTSVAMTIQPPPPRQLFRRYIRAAELLLLRWALALCAEDRTRAARFLGLSRAALYKKLQLYPELRS
jgi:DNA-binding NtrC family response regulator